MATSKNNNNYYKGLQGASANIQDLKKVIRLDQQSDQWKKKS